jgi:hypothetical protein
MAKLPKGLYQRGSTFWTKVYQHGRPIYQSTSTSNLTEAKRILDVRRGAAQRGESVLPRVDRVRWEEAQADLIAYYEATGKRDVVEAKVRTAHLGLYFAGWRIARIDTPAIHGYVIHRKQQGAAAATINRELATLSKGLRVAHQNRKLAGQPPRIEKLQENNIRQGFFEREQFEAVRKHLPAYARPVVTFMYITGWRIRSEALPLQWRQVDFQAGTVRLEPGTTKNKEGRSFYLTPEPALVDPAAFSSESPATEVSAATGLAHLLSVELPGHVSRMAPASRGTARTLIGFQPGQRERRTIPASNRRGYMYSGADHDFVQYISDTRNCPDDVVRRLPLVLPIHHAADQHVAAAAAHSEAHRARGWLRQQRDLRLGDDALVRELLPRFGCSDKSVGFEQRANRLDRCLNRNLVRVQHDVVAEWIIPVNGVQEPDARGTLVVCPPHEVKRRVIREPVALVDTLGPHGFWGVHSDSQHMRDAAQDKSRPPATEHDIVAGSHLQEARLDRCHVGALAVPKALKELRSLLGDMDQREQVLVKALSRDCDDLAVSELKRKRSRQCEPDLVAEAASGRRDRYGAHCWPPCRRI